MKHLCLYLTATVDVDVHLDTAADEGAVADKYVNVDVDEDEDEDADDVWMNLQVQMQT